MFDRIDKSIVSYLIILGLAIPSIFIVATENIRSPSKFLLIGILCILFSISFFMIMVCDGTIEGKRKKMRHGIDCECSECEKIRQLFKSKVRSGEVYLSGLPDDKKKVMK